MQLNCSTKYIQTDWGGEYRTFTSYLQTNIIGHCLTCPHTTEQNGIIERKHRHIIELGLKLLAHASMPLCYWDDAFNTATFLINKITYIYFTRSKSSCETLLI